MEHEQTPPQHMIDAVDTIGDILDSVFEHSPQLHSVLMEEGVVGVHMQGHDCIQRLIAFRDTNAMWDYSSRLVDRTGADISQRLCSMREEFLADDPANTAVQFGQLPVVIVDFDSGDQALWLGLAHSWT